MQDRNSYIPFDKNMKKTYTILAPNMLPMHFKFIASLLETYGYNIEVLEDSNQDQIDIGLKYCHNDTCYPAVCVIGQFIKALQSGKYDLNKVALIMFQTGGGCRASNYISLIRKALKKAHFEYIPVISMSVAGIEKHPGFELSLKTYRGIVYAMLYGDFLMSLVNQCRTYEINKGDSMNLAKKWIDVLSKEIGNKGSLKYSHIKNNYDKIIQSFKNIEVNKFDAIKVGIVGEIFVKYSSLANNDLENFLVKENAEIVVPGLVDFFLFYLYNTHEDSLHKGKKLKAFIFKKGYEYIYHKRDDVNKIIKKDGYFSYSMPFDNIVSYAKEYLNTSCKMGEGWLLTSEMLELYHNGCKNIVCAQPFGCLPNHICGKGMMKPLKEKNPDINIVAIDYDAGASKINQENRIKLMLTNAK